MRLKHNRIRTIVLITVIAALLAGGLTAGAEFVKSHRAKRVIAAYASNGMLFSSNYMIEGVEPNYRTVYIDRSEAEDVSNTYFDAYVTVCNFAQQNPSRTYGRPITYSLTTAIMVQSRDGMNNVIMVPAVGTLPAVQINDAAMAASYSGTLAAGASSTVTYKLSLPRSMLTGTHYYVSLTATPTGGAYADLQPISALIDLAIKPEANTSTWRLETTDDRANANGDYAGFNYRLSGSGKGKILLGWDDTKLEISKVFKETVSATAAEAALIPSDWTGLTTIQFNVDAALINSYDIQFYNPTAKAVSGWGDVAVRMLFVEDTASGE